MLLSTLAHHNVAPDFHKCPPVGFRWNCYASRVDDVRVFESPKKEKEHAGAVNPHICDQDAMWPPQVHPLCFRFPDTILPEQAGNRDLVHMGLDYFKFPLQVMSLQHYERDAVLSPQRAVPLFVGQITKEWERAFGQHAPAVIRNTVLWFFREVLGVTVRFVRFLPPKIVDNDGRRIASKHFGGAMHIECDIEATDRLLSYHSFFMFDREGFFQPKDIAQRRELNMYCEARRNNDVRLTGLPSKRLSIEPAKSYTRDVWIE